jgi:hypothetical protein
MAEKQEIKNNVSSLELMWEQAFQQLDSWVGREDFREELLLQLANKFVEDVKQSFKNRKELTEQFSKEIREWETASREEFLTTTTTLQHFFPTKSYEEINKQLDDIQNKTFVLTSMPFNALDNGEQIDKAVTALEQYVEFRRNNRNLFVKNVKVSASIIRDNQRTLFEIMTNQVKSIFLPFHNIYTHQTK